MSYSYSTCKLQTKRLRRINKGKKERCTAFLSYSSVAGEDYAKVCLLSDMKEK
jgi:hypothetical protein